jgi:hypothetical protein
MRLTGNAWAGVAFVLAGALILLANYDIIAVNWVLLADLWPLGLIIAGLGLFNGVRALVTVAILFLVISLISLGMTWTGRFDGFDPARRHAVERNLQTDIEIPDEASLELTAGAGRYVVTGGAEQLVEAETSTTQGDFEMTTATTGDGQTTVRLRQEGRTFTWGAVRNEARIRLNPATIWNFTIDGGAGEFDLNLEQLTFRAFVLRSGAVAASITFGPTAPDATASFEIGASSLNLRVPQETGVLVRFSSGLTSRELRGFEQNGTEYRSEGYDAAERRLTIDIRSGASSVVVERY